jgi:two-component system, chemotaxis family, protein-glutamate methylesterase/glutaminase
MGEEDSSARNGPRITRISNGTPNGAVTQSELIHFVRPSTDLLVESVATSLKDRAIRRGPLGIWQRWRHGGRAIQKMGGSMIIQD